MTNEVAFVASASDLCPNGGKRPRTNEVTDCGGSASSPSPLSSLPMSFKDKVSADFGKAEDNMVIGDEDYFIQNGEVPSIHFSDKIKECLYRPWKSAIIIKLMGRPLTFNFLRDRLLRRWQLKGPMTLIDLENNFFYCEVLAGRRHEVCSYWRFDVLEKIENLIGITVKVDPHTMSQSRGKFARICVELDISKPLTPFIEVEGRTYGVVYEGIQVICFECGHYGHGRDNCPLKENAKTQASEAVEAETMKNATGLDKSAVEIENLRATRTDQVLGDAVNTDNNVIEENSPSLHGQWMLLKREKNKKKYSAEVGNVHVEKKKQLSTGSRFTILEVDGNRGDAFKDATNANQKSPTGVKKATRNLDPKRSSGKGKLPSMDCVISQSRMADVNLGNKTMPLNCVGAVGLQVQGSEVQHDVQGVFSFNVGVPPASLDGLNTITLTPVHGPPDIESMDVTNEGHVPNDQESISIEHSQAWKGPAKSGSYLSNELAIANDGTAAIQRDKLFC
ncbi:hypothetical protein SADUNF_Sadunf03G0025000 [Salix dunnii]|uniref:CCHC-type domain-containing protein n=1 Tax=Salix dunnii TaxID=1413687 RepID=A0A835K8L9_9ROSI|nr:hypothetical protein SADUNF_Sadunf03G0025000 [Salix dunnii]